jgi:putative addiction module component (TIGR02574 family)
MTAEFAPLFKLGRAERLQLVVDLWDSIAAEDAAPDVSPAKREELLRRLKNFEQNPESGLTWEQVKQQARAAHD